jgi:hypothetical protein
MNRENGLKHRYQRTDSRPPMTLFNIHVKVPENREDKMMLCQDILHSVIVQMQ